MQTMWYQIMIQLTTNRRCKEIVCNADLLPKFIKKNNNDDDETHLILNFIFCCLVQ